MKSAPWTWDELILAFNLYCRIPQGLYHRGNPEVIGLESMIGRNEDTPKFEDELEGGTRASYEDPPVVPPQGGGTAKGPFLREFRSDA